MDIKEILATKTKEELIKFLQKQLNSVDVELRIEHGSKTGDNFMGEVYRVLYEESNEKIESSLILKVAPRNPMRRERMRSRDLFVREINMYDKILSFFEEFQLSKGVIPGGNVFNESAKCYFSISEELSESLFLEDLRSKRFEMINYRKKSVTFEHVSLVMNSLGKFHGISFALKDQQPEKFKELASLSFEQYWTFLESEFNDHYFDTLKRLTTILEEKKRFDLLEKFNRAAGVDQCATIFNLVASAAAEPYAVICHGDLTTYNSMFRYDEQGKAVEVKLIDWQFTRYASPITDLVLYLFCSTTKELRDQHYEDFLKIYYGSLCDLLTRLGSDPQKMFPYEALLEQMQKFGIYTIFVGAFLFPMLYADPATIPNFDDVAEKAGSDESFFENIFQIPDELKMAYNNKITDLFIDLERLGCM
ncbi:uncharacterized oxidoreductase dhs-27-like [Sitodiplosis mosellana]|uniref:uncharacterized oxidoreductase dhs-27-like n=1 Tax=Sitodiplosis mosellana TaxID=263140 RepID=UPI0024446E3A|nr:uncharacterized oxidoreductase dhs-27-like [Sitodiplosis mosellana]